MMVLRSSLVSTAGGGRLPAGDIGVFHLVVASRYESPVDGQSDDYAAGVNQCHLVVILPQGHEGSGEQGGDFA